MENADAILRFLESIGRRSEAEFYLSLFQAESKERFANLVVESAVMRHAFEAVELDLRYLHALGLAPVVTLGLFQPGVVSTEMAERLRRRLGAALVPTSMHPASSEDLVRKVAASARAGEIPIVLFRKGEEEIADVDGRFDRLGELVCGLGTHKLIFVGRRGGLRPRHSDRDLPIVNLATDFERITREKSLAGRQLFLLSRARELITRVPQPLLVAFTSPLQLLRELFTVKGAGTLIKRGSTILRYDGWEGIDLGRLQALLESSFGRSLQSLLFSRDVSRVYLEESYRGAAIVTNTPLGGYLSKFAVDRQAQGEGMGRDLWQLVIGDYPRLFWRSRPDNPVVPWYIQQCDGMARVADWHVFWRQLPVEQIASAVRYALDQPRDFADEVPKPGPNGGSLAGGTGPGSESTDTHGGRG